MKEIKIFIILIIVVGALYIGVEPIAKYEIEPHFGKLSFNFEQNDKEYFSKNLLNLKNDLKTSPAKAMVEADIKNLEAKQKEVNEFYNGLNKVNFKNGDAKRGKNLVELAGCASCHSQPEADSIASFGVVPPPLNTMGYLYNEKDLASIILNPVISLNLMNKYSAQNPFVMPNFEGLEGDKFVEVADIVAYLKSIAPKKMSDKEVFRDSCERCHSLKYADMKLIGDAKALKVHLGVLPPDLSMSILSKGKKFINHLIAEPQLTINNTAMPRVMINKKSQEQIIKLLENTGDSKKEQRRVLSAFIILYFIIFSILAYLFKKKVWKNY